MLENSWPYMGLNSWLSENGIQENGVHGTWLFEEEHA
jgi:hypothetical protein